MTTRTAAQSRIEARISFDAFLATCPSRAVLDTIGGKWVTLVLVALSDGPRRYNDLARQIAGVSPKMLTQTLRELERAGLVTRTVTPSVPTRVDYDLTPLGSDLLQVVLALKGWAESNITAIEGARARYDAHPQREP